MSPPDRQITVSDLARMKAAGQKITMLTAYDHTMASLLDSVGIEGILVGDSLSTVVQGHPNTLRVTLDEMIYHAEMVGRAVRHALVVVDMPFLSYQLGKYKAIENAGRVLKQTHCQAVKLEQGPEQVEITAALVSAGIPVMAHFGLRPQSIHQLGGYRVQRDRQELLASAKAAEEAGAFSVVLECVPTELAAEVSAAIGIPTIGIGAGAGCDGQVLVVNDLLGLTPRRLPRHAKAYADLRGVIAEAVARFREDVREGAFPGPEQSFD
jgi:3-methyl-2-oxobutanoate hydroxymethyltransferase